MPCDKSACDCTNAVSADPGRGGWIQTFTGRAFYPLDPNPADIVIEDIAHALSNMCRYTGHCREFYSVAEHSVRMARQLLDNGWPDDVVLWGLLHDASEAYLVDVPRPIKSSLIGYREMEARVMTAVAERFRLPWPQPDVVSKADLRMLATEFRDLMSAPPIPWKSIEGVEPFKFEIEPWSPSYAKDSFLFLFSRVEKGR